MFTENRNILITLEVPSSFQQLQSQPQSFSCNLSPSLLTLVPASFQQLQSQPNPVVIISVATVPASFQQLQSQPHSNSCSPSLVIISVATVPASFQQLQYKPHSNSYNQFLFTDCCVYKHLIIIIINLQNFLMKHTI